jgi:hypothetical protein
VVPGKIGIDELTQGIDILMLGALLEGDHTETKQLDNF